MAGRVGVLTQIKYLLLPSFCLVFVLFGYIARMARAGTIESLDADYTRTAVIKGLPQRTVLWRHVLRNSLLPTIAVIATQVGYLMGGLVVIELIFNYQGIGQLIFRAATQKDFPALEAAVLVVGVVFLVSTLIADILYSRPQSAGPARERGPVSAGATPPSALEPVEDLALKVGPPRDDATMARRERVRVLVRSKSFIAGAIIVGFWVLCAIFGELLVLQDPFASNPLTRCSRRAPTTGSAPTASAATSSRASSSARATS